jgi:hypothetical protein
MSETFLPLQGFDPTVMKQFCLALAALSLACSWPPLLAQPAAPEGKSPLRSPRREHSRELSKFLEGLPPEMRERFTAAREKALEDPKLRQLRKDAQKAKREFFKAMRDKMIKIDPDLAEIVRKRVFAYKAWKTWRDEDGEAGFSSLSNAEREKLISALEKASDDAAVQAASQKNWEAITSQERAVASEEYRKIVEQRMIKIDPSVAPILEKLNSTRPQSSGAAGENGGNSGEQEPQSR